MSKWRYVLHEGSFLYDVGILDDRTLHNPRDYPPEIVRAAVMAADERGRVRRSNAAKKAAVTLQRRQERRVHQVAQRIVNKQETARTNCFVCGRGLGDPESIQRGIGSECWQGVLAVVETALANSRLTATLTGAQTGSISETPIVQETTHVE
jgi:hypothetical protein